MKNNAWKAVLSCAAIAASSFGLIGGANALGQVPPPAIEQDGGGAVTLVQYMHEGRRLSRSEVEYYCNMGDQTPISIRSTCVRFGIGGWGGRAQRAPRYEQPRYEQPRYREPRSGMSRQELQYWCSKGNETPISVRNQCVRAGMGGW